MRKNLMKLFVMLVIIAMIIPTNITKAASATNKYLVLIQNKNGWTAYDNLVEKSSAGNLMVKAYSTSKALGISYKRLDTKHFRITNGKKVLNFTKWTTTYTYFDGKNTVKKTAVFAPYTSKVFNANMAHYATLSNLSVYTQYYTGSKATSYKVLGYNGIICFSTIGKITSLPNINNVVDTNGDKLSDTTTDNDDTDMVGYNGYVTIGNVKVPALTDFSDAYKDPTGHWGADVTGDTPLEDAIDDYSEQLKKDVANLRDEGNSGENSDIKVNDNVIIAQVNGDSMLSAIKLTKTDTGYEIYLATRLVYTETDKELGNANYTTISNNILKLFCNIVTSDGNLLYDTIYKAYEVDKSVVSDTKWTTYGNFQIKLRVENGHAVIFSIKVK